MFAFALTLLVVQLEAPRSVEDLRQLVRGSVPFALTFAIVCWIWWEHNKFFRRYGLQDAWVAFLNAALMFVVLFYVYPLKYLTTTLMAPLVGLDGHASMTDGRFVMLVYSGGLAAIFGIFLLLYRHAWTARLSLGLSPPALVDLRFGALGHGLSFAVAMTSIGLAAIVPERLMWVPGVLYFLMGPLHAVHGMRANRAVTRAISSASVATDEPPSRR